MTLTASILGKCIESSVLLWVVFALEVCLMRPDGEKTCDRHVYMLARTFRPDAGGIILEEECADSRGRFWQVAVQGFRMPPFAGGDLYATQARTVQVAP